MNALAEVTAASLVITKYYRCLLEQAPEPYKEELSALVYLLIGTCGVSQEEAAYLCADRACRVFLPNSLRASGLPLDAKKLEKLAEINSKETAEAAASAIENDEDCTKPAYWAHYAARWSGDVVIDCPHVAANSALAAFRSECWSEAIQLFKDLCALQSAEGSPDD